MSLRILDYGVGHVLATARIVDRDVGIPAYRLTPQHFVYENDGYMGVVGLLDGRTQAVWIDRVGDNRFKSLGDKGLHGVRLSHRVAIRIHNADRRTARFYGSAHSLVQK